MNNLRYLTLIILIFVQCKTTEKAFYQDIQNFKKEDSSHPPVKDIILFVGSSSFTYWKDVQKDLNNPMILNRGFGGSTLVDLWRYKDDVIFAYKPKQIVIYCGENDVASSENVSSSEVAGRFKKLYKNIRKKYPDIPLAFISLKPSPSRWKMKDRMREANHLIRQFAEAENNLVFVDIWDKMLNENGYPKSEIFMADSLHMNKYGYEIWVRALNQVLVK
ncbi:MAG: G-D-S-L family lipolytic protein [Saprospiraceae bacterium]|nr:G-D-S-L family lipolytic protein [Saprospiraceae bacterium]